jgi:hypothetical protein
MEADRHLRNQRVQAFFGRGWSSTVEDLGHLLAEPQARLPTRAPVVAQEVRQLMGKRQTLFIFGIGPIDEDISPTVPGGKARSKASVTGGARAANSITGQPIPDAEQSEPWQRDHHHLEPAGDRTTQGPWKRLSHAGPFPELIR